MELARDVQVPAEIAEQARLAGGGWLDEVVGWSQPGVQPPVEAIRGAWRLDADGRLTGEYVANPAFGRARPRGCPLHARRS